MAGVFVGGRRAGNAAGYAMDLARILREALGERLPRLRRRAGGRTGWPSRIRRRALIDNARRLRPRMARGTASQDAAPNLPEIAGIWMDGQGNRRHLVQDRHEVSIEQVVGTSGARAGSADMRWR